MWNSIRVFFRDSETLAFARLQMVLGVIVAAAAAMDWGPIVGLVSSGGFTIRQAIGLGLTLLVQGIVTEIARRLRAEDV